MDKKPTTLSREEYDFRSIPEAELEAAAVYEYARSLPSICALYDNGTPIPGGPTSTYYLAMVDHVAVKIPNPLCWPWGITATSAFPSYRDLEGQFWSLCRQNIYDYPTPHYLHPSVMMHPDWPAMFEEGGVNPKFSATPWERLSASYRDKIVNPGKRPVFSKLVRSADTPFVKRDIISRNNRNGIDLSSGTERIALEIDWASANDVQLVKAFKVWLLDNRPKNLGKAKGKIGAKPNYGAWLRSLATARILAHFGGRSEISGGAWQWVKAEWLARYENGPQIKSARDLAVDDVIGLQMDKERREARRRLRSLFPFVPDMECESAFGGQGGN